MKNLVYIFADQWAKKAIGFEGGPVKTPNIDAFSQESMVFDNAISCYPLCSPHRGALLTGKEPYSLGLWTNCKIGLDEHVMLKPQEVTIGNVLKDAGYSTAYIGKWHLDASELNFCDEPESGAVHWDAYTPPGDRRQGFDYWLSYGAMDNHLDPHYWHDTPEKIKPQQWSLEYETDMTMDFIENRDKEKPFCVFLSWNPPHPPTHLVPEKLVHDIAVEKLSSNIPEELLGDKAFNKTVEEYFGAIEGLDANFGRLFNFLKESELLDDTIIVLSADHGEMLGSHGLMGKNIWYEESINIPLMIRSNDIEYGKTDVLFSSIDHMPTLLDMLNLPIPSTVHGKSKKHEILGGKSESVDERVFLMMVPGMPNMVKQFSERGLNHKCFGWRGLRGKNYTYIVNNGTHPDDKQVRLYYDLIQDPNQMNPVVLNNEDAMAQRLDSILKDYMIQIKDPFLLNA